MTTSAPAERCSKILLQDVLDYLWLPDVLHAMGVNRLWRDHALNHPTYYGELYLFQDDPSEAADAFFLRLSRAYGRPVTVHLRRDDLRPFMPEISNHLSHIRSLYLQQHAEHPFTPILDALCRPADILSFLSLQYMPGSDQPEPQWILPADFLADHAPALKSVITSNISFPSGVPRCFSHIVRLAFGSHGHSSTTFVFPDPFGRCPDLQELILSGSVTLDDTVCRAQHVWERLSELTFSDGLVTTRWPTFRIPIAAAQQVRVHYGDTPSALALADTLTGTLDLTILPLEHAVAVMASGDEKPVLFCTAILRGFSDPRGHSRVLEDLLTAHGSISALSVPSLADRVVRLNLPLEAWNDLIGLGTLGPFNALEELVLSLDSESHSTFNKVVPSNLSCHRLRRLVLSGEIYTTIDIAVVARFALTALPDATFPLSLESKSVSVSGSWCDFAYAFSSVISR